MLNPTNESGLKPFLQAAPRTAILTQFLGYPVAFTNTVLKNAAKDMIRNPTQNAPKVLAAGLIMTEMARWTNWLELEESLKSISLQKRYTLMQFKDGRQWYCL